MHSIYWHSSEVIFTQEGVSLPHPYLTHYLLYLRPDPLLITRICIRPTENVHHFTMFPLQKIKQCL